jgi:hypothetical protein
MYRNKLIQWGLLLVFIAVVVGPLYHIQNARFISPVKAASQAISGGDLSVVSKPTLPAATVDAILKELGSPMSGTGQVIEQASQRTNVDDAFALAVWWTETNDGAAGVGLADRNPGSVRGSVGYPSAFDGYTIYPSYSAAIVYWFNMLKNLYVNRGLSTVYLISHPYVGTSSSPLWAGKVVALMLKYRGVAPPAPIVTPQPKRATEPSKYIPFAPTLTLQKQQVQSQVDKTPEIASSALVQRVNTTPSVSSAATYTIVFFALVLALAIFACVFWLQKRSGFTTADVQAHDEIIERKDEQNEKSQSMQGQGDPRPDLVRSVRPFRSITLFALQDANAPQMNSLTATIQEMETGENFRIRRQLSLPSISRTETTKSGQSTATSSLQVQSSGLLSRYSESHLE